MFERLFRVPDSLNAHLNGPLAEERRRFLTYRADQGISRNGLRVLAYYLLACAEYLRLADRPGELIAYAEVETQATCWANRSPKSPNMKNVKGRRSSRGEFMRHATAWLNYMGRLQMPESLPGPYDDQITSFAKFLLREKGLSPRTVEIRCDTVRRFMKQLAMGNDGSFYNVTVSQIDEAFMKQITSGGYSRVTVQGRACDLRSFFSYAEAMGWCNVGLATSIKGPTVYSQETIPAGPSWDDVARLLSQTNGDGAVDIRDRAMLMFLAFYGLRGGEVQCLQLDNFDWENERVTVTRSKTLSAHTYPLTQPVGDAVLRYIREVRPRSPHREVFLTVRPPFRPLGKGAVGAVASRRLHRLGIALPHYGSHVLRHACATHLLAEGFSLKQIGDHLGHRHPDTTRIYSKVDLAALRQVADFDLGGLL